MMTEQQNHLTQLLAQQQDLINQINTLNTQINAKRELFFKITGAIEYLQETGVILPEPEVTEETTEE